MERNEIMSFDPDKPRYGCMSLAMLTAATVMLIVLAMMSGCTKTVYVPVESHHYHTDTLTSVAVKVDTLMQHDSVYVERNGDTTLIVKWRNRYRVKEIHDTVQRIVEHRDSVAVPYPVEKPLSKWQQAKMDFGGIAFGATGILLIAAVRWLVRRFRG